MNKNYCIKKKLTGSNGMAQHIIMTDGHSEMWEFNDRSIVSETVKALNANTHSGCEYKVWQIEPLTN
jgi:hypothetical protein